MAQPTQVYYDAFEQIISVICYDSQCINLDTDQASP